VERLSLVHQVADGVVLWLGYYSNYAQAKEVWFWDVNSRRPSAPPGELTCCDTCCHGLCDRAGAAGDAVRQPATGQHGGRSLHLRQPDEVGALEDGVYMLSNFAALLIGWTIGWLIGGRFSKETTA
jgi:hypothetical protein